MIFYVNDVDGKSAVTTKNIDSQMVFFFHGNESHGKKVP